METRIALIIAFLLALFLGWIATANAQPYRASMLIENINNYTVRAFNNKGQILAEEYNYKTGKLCSLLISERSGDVARLCRLGLDRAYDINDNNEVVGTHFIKAKGKTKYRAAKWSPNKGLEIISLPNNSLSESEAYGINNDGDIVGYSFKKRRNSNKRASKAFHYSPKKGSKLLIASYPHSTVGFDINESGQILLGVTQRTSRPYVNRINNLEYSEEQNFIPTVLLKDGNLYFASSLAVLSREEPDRVKIAKDGTLFSSLNKISLGEETSSYIPGINNVGSGRDDYPGNVTVNSSGWVAGTRGSTPYVMRRGENAIGLECLFPANRQDNPVINSSTFSAVINDRGTIAVGSDDGVIILRPTGDINSYFNYCVELEVSVDSPCSASFDEPYQTKPLPEGAVCSVSVKAKDLATGEDRANVSIKLYDSSDKVLNHVKTGSSGEAAKFSFRYTKELTYLSFEAQGSPYFRSGWRSYLSLN